MAEWTKATVLKTVSSERCESATNHPGTIATGGVTSHHLSPITFFTGPNPKYVGCLTVTTTMATGDHTFYTSATFVDWHERFSTYQINGRSIPWLSLFGYYYCYGPLLTSMATANDLVPANPSPGKDNAPYSSLAELHWWRPYLRRYN